MKLKENKVINNEPIFSGGLMVDGFTKGENNKIIAQGVFSTFWSWGFPATRRWSVIMSVCYLSAGIHNVTFSVREKNGTKLIKVGSAKLENIKGDPITIFPMQLAFEFEKEGIYELVSRIDNSKSVGIIPFEIKIKDWPEFNKQELDHVRSGKAHVNSLRANVHCKNCKHAYIFEETVIPQKVTDKGVIRFPKDGKYKCKDCNHVLTLKDIQGQLRASLKELIINSLGGK